MKDMMNTEPELLNERLERLATVLDEIMPQCALLVRDALVLLKEQGCAKIKEPDCRICGQSHCKYYHESRKPTECKSYIRMEGQ